MKEESKDWERGFEEFDAEGITPAADPQGKKSALPLIHVHGRWSSSLCAHPQLKMGSFIGFCYILISS